MTVGYNHLNRSQRVTVMRWWNNLEEYMREYYADMYYQGRSWNSLTGREIESIYNKKHEKNNDNRPD